LSGRGVGDEIHRREVKGTGKEGQTTKTQKERGTKMNNDLKTTLSGILAALPQILPMLGVVFIPGPVLNGITALGLALLGWYTNKK
jgi:hypothetical protein